MESVEEEVEATFTSEPAAPGSLAQMKEIMNAMNPSDVLVVPTDSALNPEIQAVLANPAEDKVRNAIHVNYLDSFSFVRN